MTALINSYDEKEYYVKNAKYAIFCDLETTGLSVSKDEIITCGMIVTKWPETETIIDAMIFKCKPNSWSIEAEQIHKITKKEANTFDSKDVFTNKILSFLEKNIDDEFCPVFIQHAVKDQGNNYFDFSFLMYHFMYQDRIFDFYKYFSQSLSFSTITFAHNLKNKKKLDFENAKLDTLCKMFNIKFKHHDVGDDTKALYKLFHRLLELEKGDF